MEGREKMGSSSSSSSSFTSDLFGSKDSSSSSSGIFGSIFGPPSKVLRRESLRPAGTKSQHSPNDPWNTKPPASGNTLKVHEGENQNLENRDESYMYQEQRVQQPCHLSSSIYYGGQDVYTPLQSSQGSGSLNSVYGEDDSGSASRGNWWQGSLYY